MKRKLTLVAAIVLMVALCLTACGKKEVTDIEFTSGMVYEYEVGATPDFSGAQATVTYSDGTTKTVSASELTFGTIDTSEAGTKKLTVTYEGFEKTFDITVKAAESGSGETEVTLTSIKIVPSSVKTSVSVGEVYDTTDIQVEATYSDGTVKIISASELTFSTVDTQAAGTKKLTVTYGALNAEIEINVIGVVHMDVINDSIKEKVYVGDVYSTLNIEVVVRYNDGSNAIVGASELTVGTIDTTTAGDKVLTISYRGFELQYPVTVVGISAVEIYDTSVASSVKVFSSFDASGVYAKVKYLDNTEKTVYASDLTVSGIDTSVAGNKTLTVTYRGVEATKTIQVVGVESITVVAGSVKNEVLVGETYDTSLISATVRYTDGTTEVLGIEELTVGTVTTDAAGEQLLGITYLDKTVNYPVAVCGVVGIVVEGLPMSVVAGEELDLTNMKVYAVYSDTKQTKVLLTEGYTTNASDLDFDVEGAKILVVSYSGTYGEFTKEVNISTEPPVLESITTNIAQDKAYIGNAYDKSGITVTAIYGNGREIDVTASAVLGDVDTTEAGEKTLTVTYTEDGVTKTAEITVTVYGIESIEVVSGTIANLVNLGAALDTSSVKISVKYTDGETATVTTGIAVSALDTTTGGDKSVTVSYLGAETTVSVHVKELLSINIVSGSVESVVRYGYAIDLSNLEIEAVYTNGTVVIAYNGTNMQYTFDSTAAVDFVALLTVTYEGKSASYSVDVLSFNKDYQPDGDEESPVNALNGTIPASVIVGTPFPYDSVRLTVTYTDKNGNKYFYNVSRNDANLKINEIDTATAGDKALTLEYLGVSTIVRVMVNGVNSIMLVPGSIATTVQEGKPFNKEDIKIRLQYTDGSYVYIDTTNPDLIVGNVDTATAGTKDLVITYKDVSITVAITVQKVDVDTEDGMIFGVSLPDNLVARDAYKKNYRDKEEAYVVGDNNAYYFYLNLLMLDSKDEIVNVDGKNFEHYVEVYQLVDSEYVLLTGESLAAMVSVNNMGVEFDFTDAAVGNTFKLVSRPAKNYINPTSVTREHVVTVVDAFNIYDAKEFNFVTNIDADLDGEFSSDYLSRMTSIYNFLSANGITYTEVGAGIVLHSNFSIKTTDIPAEFMYTYKNSRGATVSEFYDHTYIFRRDIGVAGVDFTMYGNYYSVYSYELPCEAETGVAGNSDGFSNSVLFSFTVNDADLTYDHHTNKVNVVNMAFRDNDPNSNDQTASERHMRGIICLKPRHVEFNVTNTNIDAYYISMVTEADDLTVNLNKVKFYNAWQGHIFAWTINTIQEWHNMLDSAPRAGHEPMTINISESLLAKCGGPVILVQNDKASKLACSESGIVINVDAIDNSMDYINAPKANTSSLYSYVTGQEAWFVQVQQTAMAGQILALDPFVSGMASQFGINASFTSNSKIQGVDTMNLIMAVLGTTIGGNEDYDGILQANGNTLLNMTNNTDVDGYLATLGTMLAAGYLPAMPPVFQSSAGGTCFTDNSTGCYSINHQTYQPGAPSPACFQGEYISLYYQGMGLLLEYYH